MRQKKIYFPALSATLPTLRQRAEIDPNRFKEQARSQGHSSRHTHERTPSMRQRMSQ